MTSDCSAHMFKAFPKPAINMLDDPFPRPSLDSRAFTIKVRSPESNVEAVHPVQSFHRDKVLHGVAVVRRPEIS